MPEAAPPGPAPIVATTTQLHDWVAAEAAFTNLLAAPDLDVCMKVRNQFQLGAGMSEDISGGGGGKQCHAQYGQHDLGLAALH